MMVIQGNPATAIGDLATTETGIFPADRCSWRQTTNTSGGYDLADAQYLNGTTLVSLNNAELGYIGKSGRFVKITA